ncbi:MAG: hypothetical protein HQK84_08170 [Nitrospinae bacterium]|nr:hypothetical protein [Nitrospinota bacterium]
MNLQHQQKVDILKEFIIDSDIFLCVNATHEGVIVPQNHKKNVDLRLIFSLHFRNKPDFQDDCIESVLLFGGVPRKCRIPYDAIWGVIQKEYNKLYFWQDEMPLEIRKKVEKNSPQLNAEEKTDEGDKQAFPPSAPKKKPKLMVIENKKAEPVEKDEKTAKNKSRAHLKVLK